jgi:hypothetical protein
MTDNSLRQRVAIPMPPRIARLPRTKHGLPVPYIADEHEDGSPNLGTANSITSGDCHRESLCSICGEKLAAAERTFITGPSCVFGSDYGCGERPSQLRRLFEPVVLRRLISTVLKGSRD